MSDRTGGPLSGCIIRLETMSVHWLNSPTYAGTLLPDQITVGSSASYSSSELHVVADVVHEWELLPIGAATSGRLL